MSGASSIGKSHIANGIPNQDSFRIKKTKDGYVLAVADGIGSHKYSKKGSKAICKAACKTFHEYSKGSIAKEDIGNRIEALYKKLVWRRYRKSAGTTCLFVFIKNGGEVIVGQAGDGVILIKLDSKFLIFKKKEDDFMNEVDALSCTRQYRGWKIRNLKFDENSNYSLSLLLTTDGISEDIIPEKREAFMDHFVELIRKDPKKALKNELDNWSAPGSVDDKTAAIFSWRK